jgi:MFS family permease
MPQAANRRSWRCSESLAAGFLARPVGAVLFGHFGDRAGRKRALMASALLNGDGEAGRSHVADLRDDRVSRTCSLPAGTNSFRYLAPLVWLPS